MRVVPRHPGIPAACLALALAGTAAAQTAAELPDARVRAAENQLAAAQADASAARARAGAAAAIPLPQEFVQAYDPRLQAAAAALEKARNDAAEARARASTQIASREAAVLRDSIVQSAASVSPASLPAPVPVFPPEQHPRAAAEVVVSAAVPALVRTLPPEPLPAETVSMNRTAPTLAEESSSGMGGRFELAAESPFLPAGAAGEAGPAAGSAYELRGIMSTSEGPRFYIYDASKRAGVWAGLNESGFPFVVSSADPRFDSVTIKATDANPTLLTLREPKVSPMRATFGAPGSPNIAFGPQPPEDESTISPQLAEQRRQNDIMREKMAQKRMERLRALKSGALTVGQQP